MRVPSKLTSRMVITRSAFDAIRVAEADGLFAAAEKVLDVIRVPDAEPFAKGLVEGPGAIGFVGRKKVNGTTIGGKAIKKPRSLRLTDGEEIVVIVGVGFPGRFVELGTVDTPAEPFLTPAVMQVAPGADVIISAATKRRISGMRDSRAVARFGVPER